MLERLFQLRASGTDVRTEVVAGLTTFMTMAYIIFVNPSVLQNAGLPKAPTIAMTCLGAAIPTLAMGLWTNYPLALAPGMGLNALLAFSVCQGMHLSWQTAMGIIFVEGTLVTLLVLAGVREMVMNAIPIPLKRSIGVGIGLLIALIGLQQAGFVVDSPATLITFGSFHKMPTLVALAGLILVLFLMARQVTGALLLGIALTTVLAIFSGVARMPDQVVSLPDVRTFGQLDLRGALKFGLVATIFAFMVTDFFDTMGTVIGIGTQAGFLTPKGEMPRLGRVLLVDSLAALWGGLCSASSVTTYIESAAGVGAGGRTGLVAVVVALLFGASLFFAPLVSVVPKEATAPALIVVGFLMMRVVREIDLDVFEEALPAFLTILTIPATYSIAHGIGYGFIAYTLIQIFRGRPQVVHPLMYLVSGIFAVSFALG